LNNVSGLDYAANLIIELSETEEDFIGDVAAVLLVQLQDEAHVLMVEALDSESN